MPNEQAAERDRLARLFACWCLRQVWHLLTDERSRTAIEVAERYAVGEATLDELNAATYAAYAAYDTYAASAAAAYAAYAAYAADAAADAKNAHADKFIEMFS